MLSHRVLHADETPVAMLDPGAGKAHQAYLWSYCTGQFEDSRIVVYDFAESRVGGHAMELLGDWRGALVCDDYSGYNALLAQGLAGGGLHGPRTAQVLRSLGQPSQPDRRAGAEPLRQAVPDRALGPGVSAGAEVAGPAEPGQARGRCPAYLAHATQTEGARRLRHSRGHRLQPQTLGCADALPR